MLITPDNFVQKTNFRANLSFWLKQARGGKRLLISDRGQPIAVVLPWKQTPQNLEKEFSKFAQALDRHYSSWNSLKAIKNERLKRNHQLTR